MLVAISCAVGVWIGVAMVVALGLGRSAASGDEVDGVGLLDPAAIEAELQAILAEHAARAT